MSKSFDELTIADDFMFCTVMKDEELCKELLTMILKNRVGTIVKIIHQKAVDNKIGSKSVRLDLMIEDDTGKLYDIEMQTTDQKNLPVRMRYYQCAIDESSLNKGSDYNDLPDTFIIFFCTFDYLNKGLPVYTITPSCAETGQRFNDGTTKIIINSKAAEKADGELKEFLQYMNGKSPDTAFTKKIEERVSETKEDEARRREYMNIQSFEMDARRAGIQAGLAQGRSEGMQAGIARGRSEGFSDGARQTKLETAQILKRLGDSVQKIIQATGLTKEEIEKL
ncbi:Rpn family recombination-promoting nuclease/putative transposase [Treponema pedis]|uniref:Rpn family recombination-promoting nuclease/putative transposase n=2 Tax=Treponema pedis TaxID=409322 RepID=A0A7S7AWM4_9SPIR|nr:Rpn family recombination-promoting nuclease/putative transposase [Treponema pedis]QOW60771.1 Rpn family recombination-promoting nuclease/putative transposase [Treponema pedis]